MINFSHHVFYEVAKQLSFSKAAEQLFLSQPAISKHIRALEDKYQVALFIRLGQKIALTDEGTFLFNQLKKAIDLERQLEFSITGMANQQNARGSLVIGASTTVALYVIPKLLSAFHQKYPAIQLRLVNRNSENILKALMDHEIDFAVMEGKNKITTAKYKFFITDEVIPVVSAKSELAKSRKIDIKNLSQQPIALRERGSGTLAAVAAALEKHGISINDFQSRIILGGTEALKNFLLDDTCIGFLPLRSVNKELQSGTLIRLQIPGLHITREFYFVQRQGTENDKIHQAFIKSCQQLYNKK